MWNPFNRKKGKPRSKSLSWLRLFSFNPGSRNPDDPDQLIRGYEGLIFACVNLIASRIAGTRLRLWQGNQEVSQHPGLSLIQRPNPHMTGYTFKFLSASWMELAGNAYWVKTGGELWPLPPQWVRVVPGQWPRVIEGYIYKPPWLSQGLAFKKEDVLHFKKPNPQDPLYYGASTLRAAFGETEYWRLASEYRNKRLEKGGLPPAAVVLSEQASPDDLDRIRAEFTRLHAGTSNAGKPAILPPGTQIKLVEVPPVDSHFAEALRLSRENILAIFGVPGSKLGLIKDVNRANAEANDLTFINEVIRPRLRFLEDVLNAELITEPGLSLRFDDPVPKDWEFTLNKVETLVRVGVMSVEEARREMGLG